MPEHVKPTKEELAANAARLAAEAEALPKEELDAPTPEEVAAEAQRVADEAKKTQEAADAEAARVAEEERAKELEGKTPEEIAQIEKDRAEADAKSKAEKEEADRQARLEKDDPEYKKRFAESTRQAQILESKNRKVVDSMKAASELPKPTPEEMKQKFTSWDEMTEVEQQLATENEWNTRKFAVFHGVVSEFEQSDSWRAKVGEYVLDPKTIAKYPELDGREEAFLKYATHPTRVGAALEDVAAAFLYQVKPIIRQKGNLMERGTGGPKTAPEDPTMLTAEQAENLRKTDYRKYTQALKDHKIKPSI